MLARFVSEGCYAKGVINELPASTYPNHTTLLTGVPPDVDGPEVSRGKDLGEFDMVRIAPTIARMLGVTLTPSTAAGKSALMPQPANGRRTAGTRSAQSKSL